MQVLRTPDEAFAGLADYPFAPHYHALTDRASGAPLRLHHVDEGNREAAPVVTCFSDKDAVTLGSEKIFISQVPGAKGLPHAIVASPDYEAIEIHRYAGLAGQLNIRTKAHA